ncbi:MAG TPA: prolyl oligopeptidase family serine peptidase [Candidatus Aminicenantes bacterium]|nr:prolyl oligopeptidase family serine peptidase [Candidatus Aminicenantes bacterium]HRY66233.1 prolyl oligopeptidase family serine peptidase [Candidatus Aminicenantes bacterium]HRZ73147.1 prolyl oligopeptidase family serine peptidase [Candidatus Aminicenantes bacterium]
MKRTLAAIFGSLLILPVLAGAQAKKPATAADFGKWESLARPDEYGGLSPDGRWLAYGINRSDRSGELRVLKLADGSVKVAAFGARPVFSSDSRWVAYAVGMSEADQDKLKKEKKPVHNKLGLLDLGSGLTTVIEDVESFAFSRDGGFLAMAHYAPAPPSGPRPGDGAAGSEAGEEEKPGVLVVVRSLATGKDVAFGNVAEFAWQDAGRSHLLALAISAEGKAGNGVQLFDPATGVLRALDSSAAIYGGLAWRKNAPDLAVFRAKADDRRDGPTQVVLAWTGLGAGERARAYDPGADKGFPEGLRTVTFRRLSWSEDGRTLVFGLAAWDEKPAPAAAGDAAAKTEAGPAKAPAEEPSTVEVWHWKDVLVMPFQKNNAAELRKRHMLAAWHLDTGAFVRLGQDAVNEVVIQLKRAPVAAVVEWSKYAMNRTIGRPAADLYLQDLRTGARTKIVEGIDDDYLEAGPSGRYLLYLKDDQFWTVDTATRALANISRGVPASFIDTESDQTGPHKPAFGLAGWTKDDAAVLLYDKYDVWQVASNGSGARRLTDGAAEKARHRLLRLDPEAEWYDLAKPVYVQVFGELSKRSGFARIKPGAAAARLVWLDKGASGLAKAKGAETYVYIMQDYDDSPDLFVGGPELQGARQVTTTNPFQADYAWGRSELVDFKTEKGRPLQGALFYPAGYEPGKAYPMIVYIYELLSQNVHRYVAPSEREYYNTSVFTSRGYFVFQPDIVFRPRQPGISVAECVTAGVRRVLETGLVDPRRVGVVGHSMGGFDASFLATHTDGVFAAAVAGAPITDLVSYYGDHHWGVGIAETDHIETGQERMVDPLYERFQDYVDNSAVFGAHSMTVPLLLEAGDVDGIVGWHQSVELYNIARRAGRNVVMVAYMGEDHGLRQKKNQIDYQRRILAWFGHYLKGEPAEPWITEGQSYLDRQAEVKRLTGKE